MNTNVWNRLIFEKLFTPTKYVRKSQAGIVTQNINPSLKQNILMHIQTHPYHQSRINSLKYT